MGMPSALDRYEERSFEYKKAIEKVPDTRKLERTKDLTVASTTLAGIDPLRGTMCKTRALWSWFVARIAGAPLRIQMRAEVADGRVSGVLY